MTEEHKSKKANPNRAGMYFSLFICILALAIGAFSAINRKNELYNSNAVTEESVVEIRKNQTDIKKQETTQISTTQTTAVSSTTVKSQKTTTTEETQSITANHFIMPLGGTLTKKFDKEKMQYSETFGDWRLHLGIDISAKSGTEVFSSGKGKVKKVYKDDSLGDTVAIDHGNGIVCYYCGLSNIVVNKGDIVEIGKKIGVVGEVPSEISEKPHLHFEVEKDGAKVNPIKELELDEKND